MYFDALSNCDGGGDNTGEVEGFVPTRKQPLVFEYACVWVCKLSVVFSEFLCNCNCSIERMEVLKRWVLVSLVKESDFASDASSVSNQSIGKIKKLVSFLSE
mmetsp:Transcript_15536/g.31939  ORF Transcript_15536/g.31939 Transcript_15536/m.31939 type:complete len:102 (-) Transcript_15536:44-349(-)